MRKVLPRSLLCQKVNDIRLSFCFPRKRALTCGEVSASPISLRYNNFISHCFPHIYEIPFLFLCCKAAATNSTPASFGSNPSSTILMMSSLPSCSVEILIVEVSGLHPAEPHNLLSLETTDCNKDYPMLYRLVNTFIAVRDLDV